MSPRRLVPLVLAAAVLGVPSAALAGAPGSWTPVTPATGVNIDQVTLLRTPDGVLHVAWLAKNAADATREDLATAPVSPAGAVGAPVAIETGWASLSNPALAAAPGGGLRIFFGGIRSLDP